MRTVAGTADSAGGLAPRRVAARTASAGTIVPVEAYLDLLKVASCTAAGSTVLAAVSAAPAPTAVADSPIAPRAAVLALTAPVVAAIIAASAAPLAVSVFETALVVGQSRIGLAVPAKIADF